MDNIAASKLAGSHLGANMTDDELATALRTRNALVVHFSHHANMREGGLFPKDMRDAIQHREDWVLSCCVVWPGHQMQLPGSVGIIFLPSVANVVSVSNCDSGSTTTLDGSEYSGGSLLTPETLDNTFEVSGSYNEWRIKGAGVQGIFVQNPNHIHAKKEVPLQLGDGVIIEIAAESISINDVFAAFPSFPVFTMSGSGVIELGKPNAQRTSCYETRHSHLPKDEDSAPP